MNTNNNNVTTKLYTFTYKFFKRKRPILEENYLYVKEIFFNILRNNQKYFTRLNLSLQNRLNILKFQNIQKINQISKNLHFQRTCSLQNLHFQGIGGRLLPHLVDSSAYYASFFTCPLNMNKEATIKTSLKGCNSNYYNKPGLWFYFFYAQYSINNNRGVDSLTTPLAPPNPGFCLSRKER